MSSRQFKFHDGEKGAAIAIRIRYTKKANGFSKILKDGTIEVLLQKTGNDPDAELLTFLSKELNLPQERIHIIAGEGDQKKLVSILEAKPKNIQKKILNKID